MPENNPFSSLTDGKPTSTLSAREKLFADMGLSPQSKPEYTDIFAEENAKFLNSDLTAETKDIDLITLTEPEAIHAIKEEDVVIDAIFTHTAAKTPTTDTTILEELNMALQASQAEQNLLELTREQASQTLKEATEQSATTLESLVSEPQSAAILKSLDSTGLDQVRAAYTDLQQKLAANQTLISVEREAIAELRNHMRQLNAMGHDVAENNAGLDLGRKLIQADSCENLIRSISQVNEAIQQDGQRAAQLISPIKAGIEVLELRVKHINAIENLLAHMQDGLSLQKQLSGADALMHDLAKHLGLKLN